MNKQLVESAVIQQSTVDNLAEFIMIKTTFESHEEAANIAKMLVDKKLAASVQLHKIDSFYYWNEEPCNENEIELSCITKGVLYKKVEQFIKQHHSYECCQIICVPIAKSSDDFAKWIIDQTE